MRDRLDSWILDGKWNKKKKAKTRYYFERGMNLYWIKDTLLKSDLRVFEEFSLTYWWNVDWPANNIWPRHIHRFYLNIIRCLTHEILLDFFSRYRFFNECLMDWHFCEIVVENERLRTVTRIVLDIIGCLAIIVLHVIT